MKICSACSTNQAVSEFRKGSGWCRTCRNAYNKKWKAEHAQEANASRREEYAANLDRYHAYSARYRAAHRPERAAAFEKWRLANKDARAEYQRRYRDSHRDEFRESDRGRYRRDPRVSARRLVQRMVATGRLPRASERKCVGCGGPASEYDHYRGYEGEARKLVEPVCKPCHAARHASRLAQ